MHNIHDAEENYLEALYVLLREKGSVRAIDLARHLNISRASVSNALKRLEKDGRVTVADDSTLHLTDSGKAIGVEINERHQTLKQWFLSIGVSEQVAEDDACRIEHALSQETFDRMKEAIGQQDN